jgi:glutathione S-transferase
MVQTLHLYDHPVSSYAQKVRIALREKGIPFTLEIPRGAGVGNLSAIDPNFSRDNPRVEVPTLVVEDGTKIFDSTVILEYLEDKYPQRPLRSSDALERAKARMIEDVCDSQGEAINWGMGEIITFKRADDELTKKMEESAKIQIGQFHDWLTKQLGEREWFGGAKFGYADVCVWPIICRSTSYGMEPKTGTPLRQWYERAKKRESVRSVFEEFEAADGGAAGAAARLQALQKGLMRREYRDHRLEWVVKTGGLQIVREGLERNTIRFAWPHATDNP